MNMKLDGFSFDRGIERIIRNEPPDVALPDASRLAPSDSISRPELEKLLALPNLQDFLADTLRPEVENKALLTPQGFHQALRDALDALRKKAEEGGLDADSAKLLNKAARVLNEEASLRDLLNMYRSVLYQG